MSVNLDKLNPRQRSAVEHVRGPLLIMAGAGSGKTRVLTTRIAHLLDLGVAPWRVLAITFTNKAAAEMRERIQNMIGNTQAAALWVHTFHAFCVRFLRIEIENGTSYKKNFVIYDTGDSATVIKQSLKELNLDDKKFTPGLIGAAISKAKNALMDAARFKAQADGFMDEKIAEVYAMYESKLYANNALDFDDLLMVSVKILAGQQEVLKRWQERFDYVLIDEYQDTNKAQYLLSRMLAEKHKNICVVGDADQSIYAWRGADMNNILDFERDYPEAQTVLLEENYRSTKNILSAANAVIKNNMQRKEKNLWTGNEQGNPVAYYHASDEYDEANHIASKIREAVYSSKAKYKDFAVLYRLNAQSRIFEETLLKYSIPYIMVGGLRFYDRKEIRDILAYLRLIYNSKDDLGVQRIINVPKRGIGEATLSRVREFANNNALSLVETLHNADKINGLSAKFAIKLMTFAEQIKELQNIYAEHQNVEMLINAIVTKTGYMAELQADGSDKAQERMENIYELINLSKELGQEVTESPLEHFLEHVALISDVDKTDEKKSDAVTLMTVHAAKGLEFDIVFLAAMEDGIFPHSRALYDDREMEEERRLCYVGITRARKELNITNAATRMIYGNFSGYPESRFIMEIPSEVLVRQLPKLYGSSNRKIGEESPQYVTGSINNTNMNNFLQARSTQTKMSAVKEVFVPGEFVKHKVWGVGKVTTVAPKSSYQELTIVFPDIGEKKIISTGGFVTKVDK